jgi:microsomal epoxide hydrolase
MNQFSHYKAPVEGQRIHFVYEAGSGSNPQPVLLLHGWPYSFHSLLHLVKPLARPEQFGGNAEDGLDVIVPSLPGFAFSDPPANPSSLRSIAGRLHRLMTDVLGYDRYLIQGGDFGAVAGEWLAMDFPAAVKGLHENLVAFRHAGSEYGSGQTGPGPATAQERAFVQGEKENFMRESAYFLLQSTRPETLSVAMMDSPVGTAAWIIEKFYKWSEQRDRTFEQIFTKDQLLTNVMIYLVTRSFHTSIWPYAAFKDDPFSVPPGQKIAVPVAVATFPDPLNPAPPRSFAARSRSNIVQWTEFSRGGHFPFLEQPEPFLKDFQKFARLVR